PGRAAHHRRPYEKARLEGLGRGTVMVEAAAVIGVHEGGGTALQSGVDAARRLELEGAGAGPGDGRTFDPVARQEVVAGMLGLCRRPSQAGPTAPVISLAHRIASRSGRINEMPMTPATSMMTPQIMKPALKHSSGVAAVSTTLPMT